MLGILAGIIDWIKAAVVGNIHSSHVVFWRDNAFFFIAYIVSLTILFAAQGKNEKGKKIFAVFSVIAMVAICYNPFVHSLFLQLPGSDELVFARIWIVLPVWMTIAFATAEMVDRINSSVFRNCVLVTFAAGLVITGSSLYSMNYYSTPTSIYKIDEPGIDIAEKVIEMSGDGSAGILMFVDEQEAAGNFVPGGSVYYSVEQYTGRIGITTKFYNEQSFNEYYLSETLPDGETSTVDYIYGSFYDYRRFFDFSYVVMPTNDLLADKMSYAGYQFVTSVDNNDIYVAMEKWKISSFSSIMEDGQKLYVIADNMGHFIVVGGGYNSDRRQLQKVMDYCGGHVDLWILTSPSASILEGFNEIVTTEGYTIDRVYLPAIDTDSLPDGFMSEQDYIAYEDFLQISNEGSFDLSYLQTGDVFELYGIEFQVLSDLLDVEKGNVTENSMLFRIEAGGKSFLFCSYIGYEQGQYALEEYGEALNSDYVQIASGPGEGLGQLFYDAVSPDIAFCDSITDDAGRKTYDMLCSSGVECYCNENGDQSMVIIE